MRFGAHDLKNSSEPNVVRRNIRKLKIHAGYNDDTTNYDIALIELKEPLTYNRYISPVCLPTFSDSRFKQTNATVAGWGHLSMGGDSSDVLREVNVTIIHPDYCTYMYHGVNITDMMMCAGTPDGGKDACQGDSGGPLMKQVSSVI